MRVIWEQAELPEAEIIVRGRLDDKKTAELLVTLQSLAGADKETGHRIFLYRDGREFLCETASIWFFETQNGKIYARGPEKEEGETRYKLYELAELLEPNGFIQINKGTLVNIRFVMAVEAGFSGNYTAFLKGGGTKLEISRKYMKGFRKYVMEGRHYD